MNLHKLHIIDNSNINKEYISKKCLHLIEWGSGKLAINSINKMRSLWRLTNNFHDAKVLLSVTVSLNETGLAVYVKGAGLPFAQTISLKNSVASQIYFHLALHQGLILLSITMLLVIPFLIGIVFMIIWGMFHERIFLHSVLLWLLLDFVSKSTLESMHISFIINIRLGLLPLHTFQLLLLLS